MCLLQITSQSTSISPSLASPHPLIFPSAALIILPWFPIFNYVGRSRQTELSAGFIIVVPLAGN